MCICWSIDINIWVETGEPSEGPNGEDVPVAGVGDGKCLVEHAFDPLLQGCLTLETTMAHGYIKWKSVGSTAHKLFWPISLLGHVSKIVSILLSKLSDCPNTDTSVCYCNYTHFYQCLISAVYILISPWSWTVLQSHTKFQTIEAL